MEVDAWLNLRTGIVSSLNYSQTAAVYTFNPNYDGQVAQELTGRADATVYLTVSPNCPPCSEPGLAVLFSLRSMMSRLLMYIHRLPQSDTPPYVVYTTVVKWPV